MHKIFRSSFYPAMLAFVGLVSVPAGATSYVHTCSDTVAEAWKKSASIYWASSSALEREYIWLKKGAVATVLEVPERVSDGCAFIVYLDHLGRQFMPCASWGYNIELPTEAILVSKAMSEGEKCAEKCTEALELNSAIATGHVTAEGFSGPPYNQVELDEMREKALWRERVKYPQFSITLNDKGLPQCFSFNASKLREVIESPPQ